MRKGADCLSKWVGEAEKQLRLLFDQARAYQPSVIFFDEIDGLTPVRSSKQDQIHSSIVSTLLALMDGLDSRGQVIVIGATNRVDAIDPALRRPGRFDRELLFDLPDAKGREEILRIHTRSWRPQPREEVIKDLAERTNGYAGADLKALCTEAALRSLHRLYPQIYESEKKLKIDETTIQVGRNDFDAALAVITPCSYRSNPQHAQPLPPHLQPLLQSSLQSCLSAIFSIFPFFTDQSHLVPDTCKLASSLPLCSYPTFVISSSSLSLLDSVSRGILHALDGCHLVQFHLLTSVKEGSFTETLLSCIQEAYEHTPSVLFLPQIQALAEIAPDVIPLLMSTIRSLPPECPLLLMLTSTKELSQLAAFEGLYESPATTKTVRIDDGNWDSMALLEQLVPIILNENIPKPRESLPVLEVMEEPKKPQLTEEEKALRQEMEDHYLRELRDFCREVLYQLSRNTRYRCFNELVKEEDVPDYYDIIAHPMCFDTMFAKLDNGEYTTIAPFLSDIKLIQFNAKEYNPSTSSGKRIIRAAASMVDEVEEDIHRLKKGSGRDLLQKCEEIARRREEEEKSKEEEKEKGEEEKAEKKEGEEKEKEEEKETLEVQNELTNTMMSEELSRQEITIEEEKDDPKAVEEAMEIVKALVKSSEYCCFDNLIALYSRVAKHCLLMDEKHIRKEEKMRELRTLFNLCSVCATKTSLPRWFRPKQLLRGFFTRSHQLVQHVLSSQLQHALPQNLSLHVALLQTQEHLLQLVRGRVALLLQPVLLGSRVTQIDLQPNRVVLRCIQFLLLRLQLLPQLYSSISLSFPTLLLLLHRLHLLL